MVNSFKTYDGHVYHAERGLHKFYDIHKCKYIILSIGFMMKIKEK